MNAEFGEISLQTLQRFSFKKKINFQLINFKFHEMKLTITYLTSSYLERKVFFISLNSELLERMLVVSLPKKNVANAQRQLYQLVIAKKVVEICSNFQLSVLIFKVSIFKFEDDRLVVFGQETED